MRNIGLLFLGWIWVTSANAQPNHRGILRLYGTPHFAKLTDTATLRWLSTQMGKGIETIIYHRSPPKLPAISDTARWQLQYYHYYCEDGIVYSKRTRTNQFFVNRQAGQTATTDQVLSAFGVKGKNRKLLPYYPIVPGRFHDMGNETGMFETGWQPICTSKDWLVLRKVDSYPHGGATSYYKEYRYYFRRR